MILYRAVTVQRLPDMTRVLFIRAVDDAGRERRRAADPRLCRGEGRDRLGLGDHPLARRWVTGEPIGHAEGEHALSLAVTEGNRARGLYESLGFALVATTFKVHVPE